jgi:hypothetical protein
VLPRGRPGGEDGAAEITRMYVVPAARDPGYAVVRLRHQPHAQALHGPPPDRHFNRNPVASF